MDMLIRGRYVLTDVAIGTAGILTDAAVFVSDGRVVECGSYADLFRRHPGASIVGNGRQLVMPGLIDGHSHGWGLTCTQRGISYDYLENALIDWAFMLDLPPELNAMMSAVRHLRSGCTTMHHNNWGEETCTLEAAEGAITGYRTAGIRLAYSPGIRVMNILAYDDTGFLATLPGELAEYFRPLVELDREKMIEQYFSLFDSLYDRYHGEDTRVLFGPSWVQGSTPEFLQMIGQRAGDLGGLQIHIHTLQTPLQKAYGLKRHGKSLVAWLEDLGLVGPNLTLGHAVYVNEADIELLADRKASVTHHPSCNLAVRNGIAPVYHMHRAGVNVALGIDDKGINDDEDAIMELRMIHRLHRVSGFDLENNPALDAFEVLGMGLGNAARVCGFEGEIGSLSPGMKADVIVVDLEEIMDEPWMSDQLSVAEIFLHRAKGCHVNTAIVGGRIVMLNREFLTLDVEGLYQEVRDRAARGIEPRQRRFAEMLQRIKPYYHDWYRSWWQDLDLQPYYRMNSRR